MASTAESWHLLSSAKVPAATSAPVHVTHCARFIFAIDGLFSGMVVLFGLAGNIVTIIIMLRDKTKTTMNRLLTFLAIIDGASLLLAGPFYTTMGLVEIFPIPKQAFFKVMGVTFPPANVCIKVLNQISSYLTMIIAGHRYLSICHPHKMKVLCSRRRMQIYMMTTVVVSILCYVPSSSLIYETKKSPNGVFTLNFTDFIQSDINKALVISRFILNFVIPLPCLTLMAYKIVRTLGDSRFAPKTAKERATRSLTVSILSVIAIFIVFKLPEALLALCSLVVPLQKYSECPHSLAYIANFPTVCMFINAASNVIVYTACLQGFRKKLMTLMAKLLPCKMSSSVAPSATISTDVFTEEQ